MRWEQIQGVIERLLLMGGTYAVARGWIGQADMIQLVAAALALGGAAWAVWTNRDTALVSAAAATPGTTIVTTPALAMATPTLANVVSATEMKVTQR